MKKKDRVFMRHLYSQLSLTFCFLLCVFAAQQAFAACTCDPAPLETRWRNADAIFTGTVEKISTIEKYVQHANRDLPVKIVIRPDVFYKGDSTGETFTLHDSLTFDTCTGHPFEAQGEYLIFAYLRRAETYEHWSLYNFPSGTYGVGGLCGGTQSMKNPDAKKDIEGIKNILARPQPEKKGLTDYLFNK